MSRALLPKGSHVQVDDFLVLGLAYCILSKQKIFTAEKIFTTEKTFTTWKVFIAIVVTLIIAHEFYATFALYFLLGQLDLVFGVCQITLSGNLPIHLLHYIRLKFLIIQVILGNDVGLLVPCLANSIDSPDCLGSHVGRVWHLQKDDTCTILLEIHRSGATFQQRHKNMAASGRVVEYALGD